jgi:predicted transcriptional regulator
MLRGITGDDRAAFARRVGVSPAEVAELEAGEVRPSAIPRRLRGVVDVVDWSWVDGGAGDAGDGVSTR